MSEKIERLFNIYGFSGGSFAGNVYGIDGIAPTLNCMGGGNREPLILIKDEREEYNPRTDGVSNTLSTSVKDNILAVPELRMENGCMVDKEGQRYRIRKLTPTECFRLMDVEDEDIEKMKQAGIAKTNLYKLAGNSIVVSCMYHIFRKLFIEKECENEQLSLF